MESPQPAREEQELHSHNREPSPRSMAPRFSPAKAYATVLTVMLGIGVFLPLLAAVGIFGYQVLCWARHGVWTVLSFTKFASWIGLPPATYFTPETWLGIAKAVQTIYRLPAALILFILSVCVALVGGVFQRR